MDTTKLVLQFLSIHPIQIQYLLQLLTFQLEVVQKQLTLRRLSQVQMQTQTITLHLSACLKTTTNTVEIITYNLVLSETYPLSLVKH